jgi:hypothetical protein
MRGNTPISLKYGALTNHIGDGDVTDMVFVSGPVIARLALRTRKWALAGHLRRVQTSLRTLGKDRETGAAGCVSVGRTPR